VKEVTKDMWGRRWLEQFARDVRLSVRTMLREPGHAAVLFSAMPRECVGATKD
jgi:hypothetical protein